jgi:hypothetical protein
MLLYLINICQVLRCACTCIDICTSAVHSGIKFFIYTNNMPSITPWGYNSVLQLSDWDDDGHNNHGPQVGGSRAADGSAGTSSLPTEWKQDRQYEYLKHRIK